MVGQTEHLTREDLVDYFEPALLGEQERVVEEHVANCDTCAELACQVSEDAERFDAWLASHRRQK